MENYVKKPNPVVKKSRLINFAYFLTILALIGLAYSIFSTFSFLLFIFYTLIVVMIALLTFFAINYTDTVNTSQEFFRTLFNTVPDVLTVVITLSCIALLIIILKKGYKDYIKGKSVLIFNIISLILSLLILSIHIFDLVIF